MGVEAPPRPSSKSAHGPDGVLESCHPDGYSTASSISCIYTFNPESRLHFFPFPAPQCSPFKYLSLWLLNPQSLPSNEASPGSQKTYWRPSSIKVVTLSSSSLNSKLHSIIKRKKWNFRALSERYELANTRLLWNKLAVFPKKCVLLGETKNYANSTKTATLGRFRWTNNKSPPLTF